jgi:hypothetical protein
MSINYLQSAQDDLVIDINSSGGIESGSPLQAFVEKTEANQWWTTEDVPGKSGYFWIVSGEQNLVIDINEDGGIKSGSKLQVLLQKNEDNQYWTTVDVPGMPGYFWLQSADQSLVIDIDNSGGAKSGSVLQALVKKNENNQYWKWVAAPAVAAPEGGFTGNVNYFLEDGGTPLTGVSVTITFDSNFVSSANGYSFQLNCFCTEGPEITTEVMQFVLYALPDSGQIFSRIDTWGDYNGKFSELNRIDVALSNLVGTAIDKGFSFNFQLTYDNSNGPSTCTGALFAITGLDGADWGNTQMTIVGKTLRTTGDPATSKNLAPIAALELNIGGDLGGNLATITSGLGTIQYSASVPLTVVNSVQSYFPSANTVENANIDFALMQDTPSKSMSQAFWPVTPSSEIHMARRPARRTITLPPQDERSLAR